MILLASLIVLFQTAGQPPEPVVAPLELLATKHIAVQAKVNGAGPLRLILDTGAPISFIRAAAAQKLGLITTKVAAAPGFAGLRTMVTARAVEVGGAKVVGLPLVVLDHPTIDIVSQVSVPLDGLLGYSFWGRFRTTIDYVAGTVTFLANDYEPEDVLASLLRRVWLSDATRRVIAPKALWGLAVESAGGGGVVVMQVYAGTPAEDAGIQVGDRIMTLDGRWTDSVREFFEAAESISPGERVEVVLRRGSEERRLEITPRTGV